MEMFTTILETINGIVWGPPMLVLILGTGIYLTIGMKGMTIRNLPNAFVRLWKGRSTDDPEGEISPFQALMTVLSATIGTGNIAGVATAIAIGGPGALFWMWVTALVGMATIYSEAMLAIRFREINDRGEHVGGPMYYIKNGLGKNWVWLAILFSLFGSLAGFGIGNTVQSHSVADALKETFGINPLHSGLVMMVMTGAVLLGGIKRIGHFAGALVPFMAISYFASGLLILAMNVTALPAALSLIFTSAFTGHAATGGFIGSTMILAIRWGVARGIFSNEAGLGSSPIAHAHAKTHDPFNQGLIAMLGTFIDTIIVCSVTGLTIILTGAWTSGSKGSPLTVLAFETALPGIGEYIVSISLALFAFTTIIGWSVYGERCVTYLLGTRATWPFRVLWTMAVPFGAVQEMDFVWLFADTINALMAIPNLIALLLLSPVVFKLTKEALERK